ncbi:MAG TPA: HEAT repeat domain-containing protein [Polyangiales bacterium]|nr:HEAT repeat domain-containing protein [Polyangiales bacterium]
MLENLLRDCRDYRVRARAAEALGRTRSGAASGALSAALVDRHPAVRVAAATALGQLGAADALPALRASLRDPSPAVAKSARTSIAQIELDLKRRGLAPTPARTIRYGVYIGELRDRSAAREKGMLPVLANSLGEQLRTVEGAQLIEAQSEAKGVPVYRVDGSIMDTDRALLEDKVTAHASVALLLTDDSNQTLRIVFKGAATTIEDLDRHGRDQPERVAQLAMARAVRAALRNASTAMNETLAARGPSRRPLQP